MNNELESITTDLPPPTVGEEKAQRDAQRAKLKEWFELHPLVEADAELLTTLVGPNYRSRISELARGVRIVNGKRVEIPGDAMTFRNVKKHEELADGSKRRLLGAYVYLPYKPLGRSADSRAGAQQELFR